jgi:hypothetical protein
MLPKVGNIHARGIDTSRKRKCTKDKCKGYKGGAKTSSPAKSKNKIKNKKGCGICRIGGRENFFHCEICGCCYALRCLFFVNVLGSDFCLSLVNILGY